MSPNESFNGAARQAATPHATELNHLLEIISGTTEQLEDIWNGDHGSDRYLAMLRTSVARAASITRQLVEHAGGIEPRDDRSAVFPANGSSEAHPSQPDTVRILVVDDEPAALLLFEQFLNRDGYEVVTAQSGFECLDRLARGEEFDVIVLDYLMPFMDGAETFRRIQGVAPALPVVLSTGVIERALLDELLTDGLAAFMRKPLAPDELLECIASLVPRSAFCGEASEPRGIAAAL